MDALLSVFQNNCLAVRAAAALEYVWMMPEKVLQVDIDGSVVRCKGKLVAGVNDLLYTKVSELFPENKRIVLDLTDLTHMDSMGLGTIVRLYVSARSAGCDLELVNIGKRIRELFAITKLASVLGIVGQQGISII